jgi:glycosyltransferase involved in cell wall biosynthesis
VSRFILQRHVELGYFRHAQQEVIFNSYRPPDLPPPRVVGDTRCLRLGFLGRLVDYKGIELLLDVLRTEMAQENWELAIAGSGQAGYEAELRRRYAEPRVRFLGWVPPERLLNQVDVLVVPSLWEEPLSRAVIESHCHGVPVIGANRGGIPELIQEERTGLLFEPTQPAGLARAIRRFLEDPDLARRMGREALRRSADFAPERIARQYLKVYEDCVGPSI